MARRATMRASDADREQVAERLRNATAEGRLLADELEQRLGAAFTARTYGELDALVSDLPGNVSVAPRRRESHSLIRFGPAQVVALVFLMPIMVAVVVAAVTIIASLFAVWALVVALAWWMFGHRIGPRRYTRHAHRVYRSSRPPWHSGRPGPGESSSGGWL
jgi:DUF1707 SHOCT-like domain